MNNYNELINKPTINGKELIGELEIKTSELPAIDNSDNGNVLTASNKEWISSPPLDYNLSDTPTIAGFYTESSSGAIQKTPIFKLTFHGNDYIQSDHIIDLREYTNIHTILNIEGVLKYQNDDLTKFIPIAVYSNSNEFCLPCYINGDPSFNDGYPCILLGGSVTDYKEYYLTIYYV